MEKNLKDYVVGWVIYIYFVSHWEWVCIVSLGKGKYDSKPGTKIGYKQGTD